MCATAKMTRSEVKTYGNCLCNALPKGPMMQNFIEPLYTENQASP